MAMGQFGCFHKRYKIILGSGYIAQQLLCSMFPSILNLDSDLILGSFLVFRGFNGLLLCLGKAQNLIWGLLIKVTNFHFLCILKGTLSSSKNF